MTETITTLDALGTSFRDGAHDCGHLSDELDDLACELEPFDDEIAAMLASHAIDACHAEQRLDAIADKLRALQRKRGY